MIAFNRVESGCGVARAFPKLLKLIQEHTDDDINKNRYGMLQYA